MTERDGAWMARIIAHFAPRDLDVIIAAGKFHDPGDAAYLREVLVMRQHLILARYLTRLSPFGDVHATGRQLCATDLARLREVLRPDAFHDAVVERRGTRAVVLTPRRDAASVCVTAVVQAYDLGARGIRVVGLTRPEP